MIDPFTFHSFEHDSYPEYHLNKITRGHHIKNAGKSEKRKLIDNNKGKCCEADAARFFEKVLLFIYHL